jgi:hypothetical protein
MNIHVVHRDKFNLLFTSNHGSQGGCIGVGKCVLLYARTRIDYKNFILPEGVGGSAICAIARGCCLLPTTSRYVTRGNI